MCCFGDIRANRQTNRHTDALSAILGRSTAGEVKIRQQVIQQIHEYRNRGSGYRPLKLRVGRTVAEKHNISLLSMFIILWSVVFADDWLAYGGAQYLFVVDADRRHDLNHEDASRTCRRLDAQLVSVDTDDEFELLKREIRQRVTDTGQEFAHEQWWTSGRFVDQRWVWDKKGYPPGIAEETEVEDRTFI